MEYIYDPMIAPPKFTTIGNLNPDLIVWDKKDQLLLGWILGSVSSEFLPYLVGCDSSFLVWLEIEKNFTSNSQANILHYKSELQNLKKSGMKMSEYLLKFKTLVDTLGSAGHLISKVDQILQILSGLGSEYSPSMMAVIANLKSHSVDEITSLLLTVEKSLEHSSGENFIANFASSSVRLDFSNRGGYGRNASYNYRGGYN